MSTRGIAHVRLAENAYGPNACTIEQLLDSAHIDPTFDRHDLQIDSHNLFRKDATPTPAHRRALFYILALRSLTATYDEAKAKHKVGESKVTMVGIKACIREWMEQVTPEETVRVLTATMTDPQINIVLTTHRGDVPSVELLESLPTVEVGQPMDWMIYYCLAQARSIDGINPYLPKWEGALRGYVGSARSDRSNAGALRIYQHGVSSGASI